MTTERRTNARGHAQQRVTFTNAADDAPLEGALHDVGRGGMFIVTPKPLPIGKRIDFEVHVEGGATIAGMARVIWVRESAAGDLPAGMGLKFIDVDNDALLAIDRLVGLKKNVRERTVLGMAAPKPPEAKAPEPAVKKIRERTMLGIAPPPGPAREQELSWPEEPPAPPPEPVVAKEAEPVKEPEPEPVKEPEPEPVKEPEPEPVKEPEPEPVKEPEPEPVKEPEPKAEVAVAEEVEGPPPARELPKRESGGGRGWMVGVLLIVVLGVVGFVFRDQIMAIVSPPTTPSASASTSAAPPASSSAMPSALPPASVEPAIVDVVDAAADIAPTDASVTTSTLDASMHDGGHEGGHHKLDAGPHHVHEHAHVAPSATHAAAGTDNPY